ncbi:MAG: hypothetical protein US97_C0039G0009 [Microgenomates group bacterium GW2011_GWF1_38_5]|nr:MAG: hypothetical protein US97_C0039G0009 [Microgenomates group bacterium GW2011_GWF1_38_5]
MENENIENLDSSNEELSEESVQETSPEMDALKEQNKQLFARAKKAEGFILKDGKWVKEPKPELKPEVKKEPEAEQGLTSKDVLYLAKADVHEDDIDTVLEWAKFKNISVKDAHGELKGVLATKDEERRSAQVTQTKGARGASAPTAEDLISQASKGQLPETDEGIEALAAAEMARKIALSKR